MPRHPSTQLLTSLGMRKYRLHCRIRYLLTSLRTLSHFARTTFPQRPPRSSQNLHSFVSRRSPRSCKWKQWGSGEVFAEKQRCEAGLRGSLVTHAYSTSSRDAFKTEPPIGLYRDSMAAMQLHLLGLRLGESFSRLSKHINSYFRQKDMLVSPTVGKGAFACVAAEPVRVQHRSLSRALKERRSVENKQSGGAMKPEDVPEASEKKPQQQTGWQLYPGLQLFHISSLATKFGESYSYVANHINSVFPQTPAPLPSEESLQALANKGTRRKRQRAVSNISKVSRPTEPTHLKTDTQSDPEMSSGISSEGYLHFSQHINHYFGAKVADTEEPLHHRKVSHSAHTTSTSMSHQQRSSESPYKFSAERTNDSTIHQSPQSPGLFHMSNLTTRFGENYAYMANHINQYFNGHSDIEETEQESLSEGAEPRVIREEPVSFFQNLLSPTAAIPSLVGRYLGWGSGSHGNHAAAAVKRFESADRTALRRQVVGKKQAEEKTRVLLAKLEKADSVSSVTACVEELNEHLIVNPASKLVVWQAKAVVLLLRQRRRYAADPTLQRAVRETLVLTGYVDPVKGRGIRVLAIDGGGTRGVVPLQVLRQLEALTGKRVHQLFDYVCGVSTGAVLAFMLGLAQISLDECEEMYRRFGSEVFRQNPLVGTVKMGWTHSYYNAETWEMILKEKMGDQVLIKTARDELSPKVSAVSAVVNWGTSPKAFVFRNYNHAPGRLSRYAGGSSYQLWQAVRASSAAPGYFQEFPLHGDIHQDGGLILNNPCALAVHECRLLWPNQHFQCVLSLGTGRYDNARRGPATSTSLRAKISTLIYSATDTEGVHTLLDDLLAPNVYFRFNPMLSAEVSLDESRSGPLDQLQRDTQVYLDRNQLKLARLGLALSAERTAVGRTRDWINERAWELKHSWV